MNQVLGGPVWGDDLTQKTNKHPERTWVPSTWRSCVLPRIYVDVWNSHWCLTKQSGHSVASWRMRTWEVKSSGDVRSKSPLSADGEPKQPTCGRWCPCPQLHSGEAESQMLQDLRAGGGSLCQTGSGWSGAEQTQGLGWWLGRKSTHWMWNVNVYNISFNCWVIFRCLN